MRKIIVLICLLFFLSDCLSTQKPEPKKPSPFVLGDYSYPIQRAIWIAEKIFEESKLQGLAFAVTNENETLLVKTIGKASAKQKLDLNKKFYLGSVSKVFTALLILKLVEEGKIFLDKPITLYLKNLKLIPRNKKDPPPTIRQILYHHSGLPSDEFSSFVNDKNVVLSKTNFYHTLLDKEIYMADTPGKVMSYSNLGYSLLGILIEKISNKTIEEYAKEKLFIPLKMHDTSYYYKENEQDFSKGFYGSKEIEPMYIRDLPAGSIHSNIKDMQNFVKFLANKGKFQGKTIFQTKTIQEMFQIQKASSYDFDFKIALPFWIAHNVYDNMHLYGHGGDVPPFHAYIGVNPNQNQGIVLLTNTFSSASLLENLGKEILSKFFEAKTGNKPFVKVANFKKTFSKNWQNWAGNYLTSSGWLNLEAKQNYLKTNQNVVFIPESENEFLYKVRFFFELIPMNIDAIQNYRVKFNKDKQNKKFFALTILDKFIFLYGQEKEKKQVPKIWKDRVGKYKILNATNKSFLKDFEISYNSSDELIYLSYKIDLIKTIPFTICVDIFSENLGYTEGLGRNSGLALVWEKTFEGEVLHFSGYKLRKN